MFIKLKKAVAVLLGTFLIGSGLVMASGKMEVKIGERADLIADSKNSAANYKWTVAKGTEILATQAGRNFSYTFNSQGEFKINLTATFGNEVESTTINVLSGDRYSRLSATPVSDAKLGDILRDEDGKALGTVGRNNVVVDETGKVIGTLNDSGEVVSKDGEVLGKATVATGASESLISIHLKTLPPMNGSDQVTLLGDGKVQFELADSYGDILEYRIDQNIYEDSDDNGTANNDIDNASDNSYLTGTAWSADYKQGDSAKTVAEVTLVDKSGKKVKKQVEILFEEHRTTGDPTAILQTLPKADETDSIIHLWEDSHTVSFYARPSEGRILEYRLDKNIFEDSDGDGDPKNDIDNLNDLSFKTGDVFDVDYAKTEEQIIAQLIVVGEEGKGSRVQKEITFGDKPASPAPSIKDVEQAGGIQLTADKDFVVKGDPILFTVQGLQQGLGQYSFEWDYDGDGTFDKEIEGDNTTQYIYDEPGAFTVTAKISDKAGNSAERTLDIVAKDVELTKANFSYEVSGSTVSFTNLSSASYNLTDKNLFYQWSFGDTDDSNYQNQIAEIGGENPTYSYTVKGKYLVTLTITDSDQVTDTKSTEIEIADAADVVGAEDGAMMVTGGEEQEVKKSNVFIRLLKIFFLLIVIVLGLILLIVGGFLAYLKVQHPDLTFEELIDEFKAKVLTMIGAHEAPPVTPQATEAPSADVPTPTDQPSVKATDDSAAEVVAEPTAPQTFAETTEAPEPAQEEAPAEPAVGSEPVEADFTTEAEGPVPEWLKGTEVIEGEAEEEISLDNAESIDEESFELPVEDESPEPLSDESPEFSEDYSSPEEGIETPMPAEEPLDILGEGYSEPSLDEELPVDEAAEEIIEEVPVAPETSEPTTEEVMPEEMPTEEVSEPLTEEVPVEEKTDEVPAEEPAPEMPKAPVVPPVETPEGEAPKKKKRRRRRRKKKKPAAESDQQFAPEGGQAAISDQPETPVDPTPEAPQSETPPVQETPPLSEGDTSAGADEKGPTPDWIKPQ